jgi:hypothetical protein
VQRAESQNQIHGMDADDDAIFEKFPENSQSHAVLRVIKCGHDDG